MLYFTICIFASVSDLLDYINPDEELKARELQKKLARAKVQPFYFPFYVIIPFQHPIVYYLIEETDQWNLYFRSKAKLVIIRLTQAKKMSNQMKHQNNKILLWKTAQKITTKKTIPN